MSEYRVIAWKLSDFVGADTILASGMARINAKRPLAVTLAGDANKFEVSVKTADLNGSQHLGHEEQHLFLGSELKIGNTCLSAGSRIVPELTLNTASVAGVALIVGRIVNGSNVDTPETRLVFSSTRLEPEQVLNVVQAENVVPSGPGQNCFARGTMIDTPHGALPIEHLEDGDEVFTHDGNLQLISWIGQRRLSGLELVMNPSLQPVRIMAGALTGGRPGQDLIVSQNHRLLVDDWRAPYLFGEEEILVPAKSLLNDTNVFIDCPLGGIDYFHLLLNDHNMICANGLWAETMLPDEATLNMLNANQRQAVNACLQSHSSQSPNSYRPILPALPYQTVASTAA